MKSKCFIKVTASQPTNRTSCVRRLSGLISITCGAGVGVGDSVSPFHLRPGVRSEIDHCGGITVFVKLFPVPREWENQCVSVRFLWREKRTGMLGDFVDGCSVETWAVQASFCLNTSC